MTKNQQIRDAHIGKWPAPEGQWTLIRPDGSSFTGAGPIEAVRAESDARIPAQVRLARIMAAVDDENDLRGIYPHHCAPDDVQALVANLEALADPEQDAFPNFEETDWRTKAGVCARVIKYLSGDDWRLT